MNESLKKEINALLDLIDDPDINVFESVNKRFLEIGIEANNALEDAWSLTLNSDFQQRIEYILEQISQKHAKELAENWIKHNPSNILDGYLAFSKFKYHNLDTNFINNQIESITKNIWLEINNQLTSLEKTRIINHILFQIHKFEPFSSNSDISNYFYLNQLLETKKFTNNSIPMLYLIIAQKLNLPIYGVIFKEILLLCYTDYFSTKIDDIKESNILFYIDAYHSGTVISKDRLLEIGNQISTPATSRDYLPQNPINLIIHIVKQASLFEKEKNNFKKADDFTNFYKLLNELKNNF